MLILSAGSGDAGHSTRRHPMRVKRPRGLRQDGEEDTRTEIGMLDRQAEAGGSCATGGCGQR